MTDKLVELSNRCKFGVTLKVNDHRSYHMTVEGMLEDLEDFVKATDPEIIKEMIERDTIVDLHFYPDSSIGFYKIFHYDIDKAIDAAIECLNNTYP